MERFENGYIAGDYSPIYDDGQQFELRIHPRDNNIKRVGQLSDIHQFRCPHCGKVIHINDMYFNNSGKQATYICQCNQGNFVTTITLIAGVKLA